MILNSLDNKMINNKNDNTDIDMIFLKFRVLLCNGCSIKNKIDPEKIR